MDDGGTSSFSLVLAIRKLLRLALLQLILPLPFLLHPLHPLSKKLALQMVLSPPQHLLPVLLHLLRLHRPPFQLLISLIQPSVSLHQNLVHLGL